MTDIFDLAAQNLLSPMVLFFALGFFAAVIRSDLSFPEALAKGISLYLMMAIGFKGGVEVSRYGIDAIFLSTIAAGVFAGAVMPLISFQLLRWTTGLSRIDAAAIAAHYGSISVVTFVAGTSMLTNIGVEYQGYMVAVMALMETPAIIVGLLLARMGQSALAGDGTAATPKQNGIFTKEFVREVFFNGSVLLLMGAFVIGWVTGDKGMAMVEPVFVDIFSGVLCLFLLDMGLVAANRLRTAQNISPLLFSHGIVMPLIGAGIGLALGGLIGLDVGSLTLLTVLCASASYIAVPAAMRLALPQANPAYSVTLSLAVTFPFNLTLGIPAYYAAAQWVAAP